MKKFDQWYKEWQEFIELLEKASKFDHDANAPLIYYFMSLSKLNMAEFDLARDLMEKGLQIYEESEKKNPNQYQVFLNHIALVNSAKSEHDHYLLNNPNAKKNSLLSLLYPDSAMKWSVYVSGAIVIGGGIFMYLKRNQ